MMGCLLRARALPLCLLATTVGLALAGARAGANARWPLLRQTNYVAWEGEAGQAITAHLRCIAHGPYGDELYARAIGPDGGEIDADLVPVGAEQAFRVTPASTGIHLLQLRSGWNLATLDLQDRPHAYVAGEQAPLQTIGEAERLYFLVPAGTTRFSIAVSASVTGEGLLLRVLDPDGKVALEREGDFDKPETLRVPVGGGQDGRLWSLALLEPKTPGLHLDDVKLSLGKPLPPYLAERPEWAERFGKR